MKNDSVSLVLLSGSLDSRESRGFGFRRSIIATGQKSSFCFLFKGDSLSETTRKVFVIQPDFFRATATMVLAIAWSPFILAIPEVRGASKVGGEWT